MMHKKSTLHPVASQRRRGRLLWIFAAAAAAAALVIVGVVDAKKDRNAPHPHRGVLKPYQPGPFTSITLSKGDESKLAAGQAVMKQTLPGKDEESGTAICVQDVEAPAEAVWNQILELDQYQGKVPKVNACKNYLVEKNSKEGCVRIKTKMVIGVMPGYAYESYYDHTFHPKQDSMTWRLDYDKTSDFDDVAGHWHLEPLAQDKTRVYYACDIKMKGSVPGPILNYISKAALKQATGWVKRESEKKPTGKISNAFLTSPYHAKVPATSSSSRQ